MSPNLHNEPKETEVQCSACNNMATLKTMYVDIPGQSSQVLSTYSCQTCNIQDNAILPYENKNNKGGILISCQFTDRDDLKRYICLFQNTIVKFKKGDFIYEYSTIVDITTVTEIILRNAIDEIAEMWNIDFKGSVYDLKQSISTSTASASSFDSVRSLESIQDVECARFAVEVLSEMASTGCFEMELSDPSGFSRIAPINKMLSECVFNDLDTFNDAKVKHRWTE